MRLFRLVLLLLLAASPLPSAAQEIFVRGVVTDGKNAPIPGVDVRVGRDGKGAAGSLDYLAYVATDAQGRYKFKIKVGDPLVVYYTFSSRYYTSEIERLSGAHNAIISMTLKSLSEKLTKKEAQDQILVLEGMIAMSRGARPEEARKIISDVRASLGSLDVPEELTKQVSEAWAALSPKPNPGLVNEPDPDVEAPVKTGYWEIDDGPPSF